MFYKISGIQILCFKKVLDFLYSLWADSVKAEFLVYVLSTESWIYVQIHKIHNQTMTEHKKTGTVFLCSWLYSLHVITVQIFQLFKHK